MDENKKKSSWDDAQKQAKSALDVWRKRNNQQHPSASSSIFSDEQVNKDVFLNELLPGKLCEILESWHINHSFDKTQSDTFQQCSEYLLEYTKSDSEATKWFDKQTKLVDLVKKCADDIASLDYHLDTKGPEDSNLESFDRLIQALTNSSCDQLLDVICRCIRNNSYKETLYNVVKNNVSSLTSTQQFLLITCPDYILTCDKDRIELQKLFDHMLPNYAELFTSFLPNIQKLTDTVALCLLYPLRFILYDASSLSLEDKRLTQEALVAIISKQPLSEDSDDEGRITLVHIALNILLEIVRSDHTLLSELKKKAANDSKLKEILQQLSDGNFDEKMQLHAFELLSFLVSEEEFVKTNDSAKVTELFVKNFNEALEDNKDETAEDLIQGLKGTSATVDTYR